MRIHHRERARRSFYATLAQGAVSNGAVHVQGTINGYGERCGNANLCSIIPSLQLKGNTMAITSRMRTDHFTRRREFMEYGGRLQQHHRGQLEGARGQHPTPSGEAQFNAKSTPAGISWRHIYGIGWLGGMGFTMSLFIADLTFGNSPVLQVAKVGILSAFMISGIAGWIVLKRITSTSA